MGESTLSAQLDAVFRHIASPTLKHAAPLLGCENAVTKVRRMLLRVQAVLADAEERQEKDMAVRDWLRLLGDVVCDADDLFDELTTRVLSLRAEHGVEIDESLVSNSSFLAVGTDLLQFDFASKVGAIGERLDEVAKGRAKLHLNEMVGQNRRDIKRTIPSNPSVYQSRVFGRDVEKEDITELLLSDESKRIDFDVIPVVGMGGLGKTTLARFVFDDERVVRHFKMRIWVSVSQDFDARRLTKAIIESASGDKYLLLGMEALQRHLCQILSGKRYLLVLDDVRDENCIEWDNVRAALVSGAKGSKVLVTSTSEMVAGVVGSRPAYRPRALPYDDCWSLFSMLAFGNGIVDAQPDLVMIGKEIVKKCKGLPLAVKAIGGLLHTDNNEYKWRNIMKNQIWNLPENKNEINPAVRLSYLYLPMHLKQCFLYSSVLPKNFKFSKEHLVRLWMAQDFILPKENQRLEDLGAEYFDELLWRSFFQCSHFDHEDGEPRYVVHEVIHEFARFVSGNECHWGGYGDSCDISKSARHLTLDSNKMDNLSLEAFSESQSLRTFLLVGECKLRELQIPKDLFLTLKCLRVLDLSNTTLHALPDSIGSLIHLRYLSLFNSQIERLPESLGSLFDLQTLDLGDCFEFKELPEGITKLVNLRHLNLQLHQCKVSGLSSFPPGFGQLTSLQTLSTFIIGSTGGCRIGELKHLTDLHGQICISKLENVLTASEAKEADLDNKQHIRKLDLQWHLASKVDGNMDEKVHESLQPHVNLKELTVTGYGGVKFPSWMGDPSFINLAAINISDCLKCVQLPPFGQLPFLKYLSLERVGVKRIHQEFCGYSKVACFPFLETLKFENLLQWEEWSSIREGDMPCLQELSIIGCSQIRALPSLSSVKKLEMWNCFNLPSLPRFPSLHQLVLRGPTSSLLKGVWNLTSLEILEIKTCPELTSFPGDVKCLHHLKDLVINDCKQLTTLPEELENLSSLQSLEIFGCPQLQSLPKGGLPPNLQFLNISNCPLLSKHCQSNEGEDSHKLARVFSARIDGQSISSD